MRMVEWAFEQDLPVAEKLVLVYLAWNANSYGVGPMDRSELISATGYKMRSIQRLLKSLRDRSMYRDAGFWYVIGHLTIDTDVPELPEDMMPSLPVVPGVAQMLEIIDGPAGSVDAEAIAQTVGDYVIDQFANFEKRMIDHLNSLAGSERFHVEPPPDPVLLNPLYEELMGFSDLTPERAYALSQADLEMGEDEGRLQVHDFSEQRPDYQPIFEAQPGAEATYEDNAVGRCSRIADILQGARGLRPTPLLLHDWQELEAGENKHTVAGEVDAFELIYPAICAAAAANAGTMSIEEFINPKAVADGVAPWDKELTVPGMDDEIMLAGISAMLIDLERAHDPRCEVHPRTTEKGDDGEVLEETVIAYYRRVKAKYDQMEMLKSMGAL